MQPRPAAALLALSAAGLPFPSAAIGVWPVPRPAAGPLTHSPTSKTLSAPRALLMDTSSNKSRTSESDAQFLVQATFGPTRSSLAELSQTTLEISSQMTAPVGSHREYYRKRVNSRLIDYPGVGSVRSRCAAGSRWHSFAFSIEDKAKRVQITGNKIYVDGAHRSDIDPAYLGNGLRAPDNCTDVVAGRYMSACSDIVTWGWPRHACNVWTSWIDNRYC
ncbi:unnamed protein product, partial [Prorocentrum cordatum]